MTDTVFRTSRTVMILVRETRVKFVEEDGGIVSTPQATGV